MTFARLTLRYFQNLLLPVVFLTIGGAGTASAHSFDTVMLLPASYTTEPLRDDLMQAFLLASEERDSHPDETSNGHLGGLDVYISFATESSRTGADIVATPLTGATVPDDPGAVVMAAPDMAGEAAQALLATPADPSLPPFAARFKAATGRAAGPEAKAVYVTARLIGRAVRKAGGVDDPARLMRLLSP